jgi:hypothetical protein
VVAEDDRTILTEEEDSDHRELREAVGDLALDGVEAARFLRGRWVRSSRLLEDDAVAAGALTSQVSGQAPTSLSTTCQRLPSVLVTA